MSEPQLKLIHDIINREGGFVHAVADKGGPTKYGITQSTLARWRKKIVSIEDVKNLTIPEAYNIYFNEYVVAPKFLHLEHSKLIEQVVDAGVNHGIGAATKMLQRALGVEADGGIGPMTLAALQKADKEVMVFKFLVERIEYFARILESSNKKYALHVNDRRLRAAAWYHDISDMLILALQKHPTDKKVVQDAAKQARAYAKILEEYNHVKEYRAKMHPKDQRVFAAGWLNRCAEMIERAVG